MLLLDALLLVFFGADEADAVADDDVLSDVGPLRSVILFYLRSECVYEYEAKKKKVVCMCVRARERCR